MLDARLSAACDLFPICEDGADIGADHGKLALQLIKTGKCARIQVTDLSPASLEKARKLFEREGLSDRAIFLCGDGFDALTYPAQAAAIMGMGGNTICQILDRRTSCFQNGELILSPHTDIPLVRKKLDDLGYTIIDEQVASSAGRLYILIRAKHENNRRSPLSERLCLLGPCLSLKKEDPNVQRYYLWQREVFRMRREDAARQELSWIDSWLQECDCTI
ncbi:MAG: SAM-dependent methyltransferase [Clostridia bacterium]|nr:SAM-dependent methyltransferase [Clostridia bacterium]